MNHFPLRPLLSLLMFLGCSVTAATRYVDVNGANPVSPYTSWATAATNIQDAIDAAAAGEFIVVSNGTYKTGGRAIYGVSTNRVTVDKAVTVQSVNGPGSTTIAGFTSVVSDFQIRCVYLTNGATLSGFTLTNGSSRHSGNLTNEQSGGGAWCEPGGVISNCIVMHNFATGFQAQGGGVYGGTIWNSIIATNSAYFGAGVAEAVIFNSLIVSNTVNASGLAGGAGAYYCSLSNCVITKNGWDGSGGGAYYCGLINCVVSSNRAGYYGGGASHSTLTNCNVFNNTALLGGGLESSTAYNCIISSNAAVSGGGGTAGGVLYNCTIFTNTTTSSGGYGGGGALGGTLENCIVYFNSVASAGSNYWNYYNLYPSFVLNYCCTTPLPTNGLGNITNAPVFVDGSNDFHLQSNSPCINAGNNSYVINPTDLDGHPRIVGGTVDMGAYEFLSPTSLLSYAYLQQYGLPTDGSADFLDADGDGLNNFAEWKSGTIPTNAASVLQLASPTNGVAGITVTWQSVLGITYDLQRSSDLANFVSIKTNIVGANGTTSYTDITATNNIPNFYRVGVQ